MRLLTAVMTDISTTSTVHILNW